jgi:hypothetical protein
MLSFRGVFTVIASIGIVAVIGAVAWNDIREFKRRPAKETLPPFAFAEPTPAEFNALEATRARYRGTIITLEDDVPAFRCPSDDCPRIGILPAGSEIPLEPDVLLGSEEWLSIPWEEETAYIASEDLEAAAQEPPPLPYVAIDPSAFETRSAIPLPEEPINPETLVGIACEFHGKNDDGTEDWKTLRGSGAIVTPDGYILTARSTVDMAYLNEGLENYELKRCLVGQMPKTNPLPSIEAIKKVNAYLRLPYLSYVAEPYYTPDTQGASEYETAWLDFAVMKITGVNPDAAVFGGPRELPEEFPAAPFLISEVPKLKEVVLNFSFPSGTTIGNRADIKTLFMQGLLSHVTDYWAGDSRYADDLFLIATYLDTEDTAGGRFGSPIFWKGRIIGIHTAKQQYSRDIYNLSAKAILDNLFDNQIALPLRVE